MIKAVIFDMDGVIIRSEPLWERAVDIQMKRNNIDLSKDKGYQSFVSLHIRGRSQRYVIKMFKQRYGLQGSYQILLEERLKILLKLFKEELTLIPGVCNLIKLLHRNHIPLIVASSSPKRVVNFSLKKFELKKFFTHVLSGDDVVKAKPQPDIFLYGAKLLKVKPNQTLVIEDSINGIKAASRAGMKCIALKQPYTLARYHKLATKSVGKLSDIKLSTITNL